MPINYYFVDDHPTPRELALIAEIIALLNKATP